MSVGAVVFDLDGVIVKTNLVKHAAMLSLFADHPEQRAPSASSSCQAAASRVVPSSPICCKTFFVPSQLTRYCLST